MVKRNLMVAGLALLLSACGFQLRGTGDAEFALTEIDLQARDSHGQTVQQLKDLLESNDVHVHPGARYSLNLANEQTRQRTASYTSSARSAEYELTTTLDYEFRGPQNTQLLQQLVMRVQRVSQAQLDALQATAEAKARAEAKALEAQQRMLDAQPQQSPVELPNQ